MKYIFEEEIKNKIEEAKKIEEDLKEKLLLEYKEFSFDSEIEQSFIYLLAMFLKEDSLLNCLCKLKLNNITEAFVSKVNIGSLDYTMYSSIDEIARNIAMIDNDGIITDEHLLYGILKVEDCLARKILEEMGINTKTMLETVIDYLEIENDLYVENISEKYRKGENENKYIGGEKYINKVIRILNKKQKNNCMIIGSAGVGKSALVFEVARRLNKSNYPHDIYRLDIGLLVAGTRYRGDLEERITQVIEKMKDKKGILFIDEIHMLTSQTKSEETLNMSNLLKPILSQNLIKCIGTTTLEEYYEYIEKDRAFARRFQNIVLTEPSDEETIHILLEIKKEYENFYKIKYSKRIINEIVKAGKYYPNRKNPDKSIDILDEVGSYVKDKGKRIVKDDDIKKVIFENICKVNMKKKISSKNYQELLPFYYDFINGINRNKLNKNIINIQYLGDKYDNFENEVRDLFGICKEEVLKLDLEFLDDNMYNHLLKEVLKKPILLVIINNFHKASYQVQCKIIHLMKEGLEYNQKGLEVSFHNTIFIINSNKSLDNNSIGYNNIKFNNTNNKEIERKKHEYIDIMIS